VKKMLTKRSFKHLIATLGLALASLFLMSAQAGEANKSSLNLFVAENSADNFLTPDRAFQLKLTAVNPQNIQASFSVASGYYLYRERIKFEVATPKQDGSTQIALVSLPSGEIKLDPTFGKQEVYHHDFNANIQLAAPATDAITINATYQGCSEKGLCYAPIKKSFTLNRSQDLSNANVASATTLDSSTAQLLKTGNVWLIIAGFFVAGLFLAFTPCNYPMIPILSSIIVGSQSQQKKPSKLHAFGLSVAYVLGMALTYTIAGIAAALSGDLISQSLQNPWVLATTAMLFVVLALSMFDLYELQLPSSFETKMLQVSNKLKGGEFLGVFIMGSISALIVSPCISAPLSGALIVIGQTHNILLGGLGLFAMAIGMGVPLLLIGASAGRLLPKTGNWMNAVRNFFGVLMLAMAIWLISPVIAISAQLALWSALLIVTAVYLNALDNLPAHANNIMKLSKGIAVILLLLGASLLIGALSGAKSALQPLSGISMGVAAVNASSNKSSLAFNRITTIAELEKRLASADGQPVMLDFYADWCVACKELEQLTFSDKKVQAMLQNTLLLQVDVTQNSDADKSLLKRFGLYGPPGIIFFNGQGQELSTLKTVGFEDADRFHATLFKRDTCIATANRKSTLPC
jgi:thiol:disulfide interchange protein DsbD